MCIFLRKYKMAARSSGVCVHFIFKVLVQYIQIYKSEHTLNQSMKIFIEMVMQRDVDRSQGQLEEVAKLWPI